MTYYPIRLPIEAWQYLGDGFGAQSFQDWIGAELPQLTDQTFHALFVQEE